VGKKRLFDVSSYRPLFDHSVLAPGYYPPMWPPTISATSTRPSPLPSPVSRPLPLTI